MGEYMYKGLYVGWDYKRKPFTPEQYKKSFIFKQFKLPYQAYLKEYSKNRNKNKFY